MEGYNGPHIEGGACPCKPDRSVAWSQKDGVREMTISWSHRAPEDPILKGTPEYERAVEDFGKSWNSQVMGEWP